jgi:hypothetical protein
MDPEYNFLLQIRGKKTASLLDVSDRSIVSEELMEKFLGGDTYKHLGGGIETNECTSASDAKMFGSVAFG